MKAIDPTVPAGIRSVLVHGLNNIGKTDLLGSALSFEKQFGKALYVNTTGEPSSSIMAHDLTGVEMVEVDSLADIIELSKAGPYHIIGLDSVQRLAEIAGEELTKGKYIIGSKEDHGKDWSHLKGEVFRKLELLKRAATLLVAVCPSAQHEHSISHQVRIIPGIPGVGEGLVGRFNFVGYLEGTAISPTRVDRHLDFSLRLDVVTRCNGRVMLEKKIKIPQHPPTTTKGWELTREALEAALRGE